MKYIKSGFFKEKIASRTSNKYFLKKNIFQGPQTFIKENFGLWKTLGPLGFFIEKKFQAFLYFIFLSDFSRTSIEDFLKEKWFQGLQVIKNNFFQGSLTWIFF